jgi:hypothetical protein
MKAPELFAKVLDAALTEVRAKAIPVFTFALYHNHESRAVSVCVDTEENSRQTVLSSDGYSMRYFLKAIDEGDLEEARLWQANIGRSLSLGDFALKNVARTNLGTLKVGAQFYLSMVRALIDVHCEVARLAPQPQRLLFACSGANDEVAYVWSLP